MAAVGAAMAIYVWLTPALTADQYSALGADVGYYVAPAAGIVTTLLAVLWATRTLTSDFVLHGLLVGVVSVLLTAGFAVSARPQDRPMYIAAFALRLVAGYGGGLMARRRATARTDASAVVHGVVQEGAR
jgi:hypothetical protein